MMSFRIRIIILVVLAISMIYIAYQTKKSKIDFKFALPWFVMILILVGLTIFPNVLTYLSDLVGIAAPMNLLFFFGFAISITIIYMLTVTVSKMSENIRGLTQKIAMLEKELSDTEREVSKDE